VYAVDSSDAYRAKAIEILLQADRARDDGTRTELVNIAISYARLVDRAEQNGKLVRLILKARAASP
jgi:hypothetical protein